MPDDIDLPAIERMTRDLREAAATMSAQEARYLVDAYYLMQEGRKRADNQVRAMVGEPHRVLAWLAKQSDVLENQVKGALGKYADAQPVGAWMRANKGIGPVISAGLLAHIDITKAATVGDIWRFAGLDPTSIWEKNEKRPWNASLKTLCVVPGATITTKAGPRLIEEIKIGDEVLTHRGRWRSVSKIFKNDHDGNIIHIRAHGLGARGPSLTGNHPVLTKQMRVCEWNDGKRNRFRTNPRKRRVTQIDDAAWNEVEQRIAAGERGRAVARSTGVSESMISKIRHGYKRAPISDPISWSAAMSLSPGWRVFSPTPPIGESIPDIELDDLPNLHNPAIRRKSDVTYDFARLVGLYLGDGHVARNETIWSFAKDQADLSQHIISTLRSTFGIRSHETITSNMRIVRCGSLQLANWISEHCGKLSRGKKIPHGWFDADELVVKGLVRGLFESDGKLAEDSATFVSVNWELAGSVAQLLRSLRVPCHVRSETTNSGFGICHHYRVCVCDLPRFYEVIFNTEVAPTKSTAVAEWEPLGAWHTLMESTSSNYTGPVFNLEVDDDHSYVVDGVCVHNCWKIGESFVKVSGSEDAYYGRIYAERKLSEVANNDALAYANQAEKILATKRIGKTTDAYKAYITGKLPPAHIHARAKRYAAKRFLSDLHLVWHFIVYQKLPPFPYIVTRDVHAHFQGPPHTDIVPGLHAALVARGPVS
jgi:intein/homing endonuclease